MKTEMVKISKWNKVHTYLSGRKARVWHFTFRCPDCGAEKYPLANTSRGKVFYCNHTPNKA